MDFLFVDKPAGVTTHTSLGDREASRILTDINDGFVEALSERCGLKLHVAHRLDRETTGAMIFAKTPEMAELLRAAFERREVSKRYLFLTDRRANTGADSDAFTTESFIERRKNEYHSRPGTPEQPANSRTHFRKLEESDGFALWEARPETGKSHQIRLHAQDRGLPILGDREHGGSTFPTLALHSSSLEITLAGEVHRHESPPPIWFSRRELAKLDPNLPRWLAAIDRRERLLRSWRALGEPPFSPDQTLRWMHTEGDPLRIEQLADVLSLSWFREREPLDTEWASIRTLVRLMGFNKWYLQMRGNRGRQPAAETVFNGEAPLEPKWTASEGPLKFEFRTETGLSPGLFLDQRRNRKWISEHARGKRVLNLFCYTAGFSVAAAAGGAQQVVSVDVSKVFLEWGKANFALNGLTVEGHEFRAMDSREYLAWAKKKGINFDVVICDPPSFSRSKSGLFKIEQDFAALVKSLLEVTAPGGRCLFALNFEAWDEEQLEKRARSAVQASRVKAHLVRTPSADWDFELPSASSNMKSFFFVREGAPLHESTDHASADHVSKP